MPVWLPSGEIPSHMSLDRFANGGLVDIFSPSFDKVISFPESLYLSCCDIFSMLNHVQFLKVLWR